MAQKKGKPTVADLSGGLRMRTESPRINPIDNNATAAAAATRQNTSPWLAFINEDVGSTMYYNTLTEETTWQKPAQGFQWGETFPGRTPSLDPEGLGNNYLDTPWVQPSLEQAMQSGRRGVCLEGKAPLWTSISDMNSIGEAGIVYFQFLKTLMTTFFVMSLLYLPTLLGNFGGSRIPGDQLDYTSIVSIANVGTQRAEYAACTVASPDREACEQAMWSAGPRFSTSPFWSAGADVATVAQIYVWLDVSAMILFVLSMLHFYVEAKQFAQMYRLRTTTCSDYAVQVWGLPPDALESEIIDHFNDLYNLQHKDHAERPKSDPELYPVGHYGNTCDKKYYISWVAECTTAHPTGSAIRKYKQHAHLSSQLRQARASAKRYSSKEHENEKMYTKKDRQIQRLEWEIVNTLRNKEDWGSGRNPHETVCAFIIFNNEESAVRALEDYTGSDYSWNRHFQPKHLRFLEEYPLVIKEAPDPADIIWENLETDKTELRKRSCITCVGMFAVLLVSFTIVVTALYFAAIFANNIARPLTCNSAVPYRYLSGVNNFTTNQSTFSILNEILPTSTEGKLLYVRPSDVVSTEDARWSSSKDGQCNKGNKQGTMRWLTLDLSNAKDHFDLAPITYDIAMCEASNNCPAVGAVSTESATVLCPCVDSAQTLECDTDCPKEAGCTEKYGGSDVAECFCYQAIKRSFNNTAGLTGSVSSFFEQEPMCQQMALLYNTGRFLVSSVAYLVAVTNVIIEMVVKNMVPYEHPHSISDLTGTVSMKLYMALTLNTVLSPVLAKVRLFDEQANMTTNAQTQVTALPFSGDDKYVGFPVHWYSTVGYTLVSAMILDIFVPHAIPILSMLFTRIYIRCRKDAAHKEAVTQRQLNVMFEGPEFDMATRLGYVLNTCACTLAFSSGLPILVPMAMLSFFVSFCVDKYMILRFYKRPPQTKSTTIIKAFATLPAVVLMHFVISLLTLGDSTVLVSEKIFNWESTVPKDSVFLGHDTLLLFANGADRQHMLPAVISLFVVAVSIVLYLFPTSPLLKLVACVRILLGKRHRRVSENNPPFTSPYIKPVLLRHYSTMESWFGHMSNCCKTILLSSIVDGEDHKETKLEMSMAEKMSGWVIKEEQITSQKFKMKEWRNDGYDDQGIKHKTGSLKRTWECIRDDGLYSYRIDQNPQYADAMRTMYASKGKKTR